MDMEAALANQEAVMRMVVVSAIPGGAGVPPAD
jgi:hypothetical protein